MQIEKKMLILKTTSILLTITKFKSKCDKYKK